MTVFDSTTCSRCSGTGQYLHHGSCLRCKGTGREHTRVGYRSYLYAKAIKSKSGVSTQRAVQLALAFQTCLLMKQAFVPADAGVPEEPKPRKRRSKKQPEQAAA